eukprot:CAMPEP_0116075566 /NCGR_PEP_ID=MMETSP0322-20121206/16709_1 /TAXON_ID=163516 /ORGANISM="Leptocylindrus danicus var. apora, Strain B651" /LENGTH=528 /DNA_ID=CAMNT_0003565645 /DNA_START=227 /DNA_END=1813 /DNA_ORIENTATION=+
MKKSFRQSSKLGVSTEALAEEGEATSHMFEGPFKGIARDYRKRLPFYKSDITDGLNSQCVAATMFLFFACLAPAVGFGALYYTATGGAIGTMEMVTSTAFSGILYALTSAQPLTIIGSTGPVLAFVATLYKFTARTGLPFLPVYAWTGLWTAAILFLSAITSASNLVKYLTRFTDEIFSCLISTIFIIEAVSDVARTFATPAVPFVTALLTLLCAATTYGLSTTFKNVRNTAYGNKMLRDTVSNFGPTAAVICSCLIARAAKLGQGVSLPSLAIPASFATTSGRPWLVPLNSIPVWARFASFVPALMATVLLYLDQNITVRLVNNPRFKMEKGREKNNMIDGMHADMLIISIVTALTSITGLPWLVAATVRSVSHVRAVSVFNKEGKSEKIFEQRLTGLGIHSLIGACILFNGPRSLMSHIVLPSLMGLFMYLGISSLPGVQMWERFKELFKDRSIAKDQPWSGLKRRKVNLFTLVQVASLYAMFWVKGSSIGVLFPILIAALAPFRIALERLGLFSKEEMNVLDSDE